MGIDGWGQLIFYYDYERPEKRAYEPERMKGLICKAYKFTGVNGIILHAYNGIKYFLNRYDNKFTNFSPCGYNGEIDISDTTGWARLNTAFDIFFDLEDIEFGSDSGKEILTHLKEKAEEYKNEDNLSKELYGGAQEFGLLSITFTGDPREGYALKYRYYYDENEYDDLQSVIEQYNADFGNMADDGFPEESVNKALEFFRENAVHDGSFETDDGAGFIRELINKAEQE